ncbi:MAG: hybrid sensor histidine kinase/response regulator [Deltaproteobacteria bacterium]|nr:hybrid sensor histidine kinase/response regulator [Deltaproteobacteria bacterium]
MLFRVVAPLGVQGYGQDDAWLDVQRRKCYLSKVPYAVYLVDDDPLVTESLGTALRIETTYDVVTFLSGTAALGAMPDRPPDVLITDFKMPGLDGLALLRAVRQAYPDAVLMLLTGYADKESAIRAINEVGIFQYVEKPWDLQDLLLKLRAGLERRELTASLTAANLDLARRNEELARSLSELARAHEELRKTHERLLLNERLAVVGRVASGIAHEIGNQLTLVGYAQAIREKVGARDPQVAEYADIITTAQKRLAAMVTEIKDFTRGNGDVPPLLSSEPTDVALVIEEALSILRYDDEVKACKTKVLIESRPLALLDRAKLTQVLINLLRNAAQASKPGGEILVSVGEDAESRTVQILVEDEGTGMPEDVLSRLGEPFFSTKGERGTGLGLGISRRIVEGHDGVLSFASQVGQGTRVTITLPSLDAALERKGSARAP